MTRRIVETDGTSIEPLTEFERIDLLRLRRESAWRAGSREWMGLRPGDVVQFLGETLGVLHAGPVIWSHETSPLLECCRGGWCPASRMVTFLASGDKVREHEVGTREGLLGLRSRPQITHPATPETAAVAAAKYAAVVAGMRAELQALRAEVAA